MPRSADGSHVKMLRVVFLAECGGVVKAPKLAQRIKSISPGLVFCKKSNRDFDLVLHRGNAFYFYFCSTRNVAEQLS